MQITDYEAGRRDRRQLRAELTDRLVKMAGRCRVAPAQFALELLEIAIVEEFRLRFPAGPNEPAGPEQPAGRTDAAGGDFPSLRPQPALEAV